MSSTRFIMSVKILTEDRKLQGVIINSLFYPVEGEARCKRHYQNSQFLFKPNKRNVAHLFAYKYCRSRDDRRNRFFAPHTPKL